MKYISTRGQAPELGFCDAVMAGLAQDGGLYLPKNWPRFDKWQISRFANKPYTHTAYEVISPFVDGEIEETVLREMIEQAYACFPHPSVAPIIELEPGHFVLELFHGPTLAFKDVAMQLLARIVDHILAERAQRATIIGATSGDTGSAAIEAFRNRANIDIFILHPHGRVSDVQRRQMTTVLDKNVHNIALKGSFDDCQKLVKDMFTNIDFRRSLNLTGVNSINWGRIVAQIVYYFTASVAIGTPHRPVNFTVPTGNFGDIFAGYAARQMGLNINRLVIATNSNDILYRAISDGNYRISGVVPTQSPSMDIQISSNFERLLFEAGNRDCAAIRAKMYSLANLGGFDLDKDTMSYIAKIFAVGTSSENETFKAIKSTYEQSGYLLDPHSAVGVHVARNMVADFNAGEFAENGEIPMITLATAHPAKFPVAVESASSVFPSLPPRLADIHDREEKCELLANDPQIIQEFIRRQTSA